MKDYKYTNVKEKAPKGFILFTKPDHATVKTKICEKENTLRYLMLTESKWFY